MSPAGWYPDPWLPTRWRYFDGSAWTGWVHPPDQPRPTAIEVSPTPTPQQEPHLASPVGYPVAAPSSPGPTAVGSGINSSPAAWWWAGGTLGVLLVFFVGLAWLVNR